MMPDGRVALATRPGEFGRRHALDVRVLSRIGAQTWAMYLEAPDSADRLADPDAPGQPDPGGLGLGGVRDRIGIWRGLLDRPLTSYYLVLGITILLLGLGVVMVQSTASVADLSAGLSPYSGFKKELVGAAVGLPLMWAAARAKPRIFRAFAYPLLAVAVLGLGLTLIHGVGVSQNGATRWINVGGQQVQPSEIAKLALVVWGADLLARKDRLGQLSDWRHMLVPLMPGTAVLCLMVMTGDDLGTTFILLVIFLSLLWVIGTPGRGFRRAADPDGPGRRADDHLEPVAVQAAGRVPRPAKQRHRGQLAVHSGPVRARLGRHLRRRPGRRPAEVGLRPRVHQ